jgi:hypothetical protein
MIYSVWNQGKELYDYYESPEVNNKLNTPKPKHLKNKPFGLTVTQAAWPLPSNARYVGSGDIAKGKIASRPGALGAFEGSGSMMPLLLLAGVAVILWKTKALS